MSKKQTVLSFGELCFFCVWLTFWSFGVAFIQNMALSSDISSIWIFVVSHGGSEVLVLRKISSRLKLSGERVHPLKETQDMDSLVFRWRLGDKPRPFTALLAAALAVVTYCILLSPIIMYLQGPIFGVSIGGWSSPDPSILGVLVCILFTTVWIYTMTWWVQAYIALSKGMTIINLRIESHRLLIQEERLGPDAAPLVFTADQLQFDTQNGLLQLSDDTKRWQRPYPTMALRMLEEIRGVIHRGKHEKGSNRIPDALSQLRGINQEGDEAPSS